MDFVLHSLLSWTIALTILSSSSITAHAATLDDWRSRTIYQVLTDRFAHTDGSTIAPCDVVGGRYCGGSWRGIIDKLDYIQGMGFDALWISPVSKQLPGTTADGAAYPGYWAQDLYSLNSHFGDEDDLKALVAALHKRDMYLMLDVAVNHMGYAGRGEDVDYSVFNPFNQRKYFHDYCRVNGDTNQTQVEVCWLGSLSVPLPDLRTEDEEVRNMLGDWIRELVSNYSIDGLRLDTTINIEPDFFPDFVDAAGVFATGETMDGDNRFVCRWADTIGSILNYPIYYPLIRAFSSPTGSIGDLVTTMHTTEQNCDDPTAFGTFSENHDVPRFTEYTNDTALAKNILAYTVLGDGIPIIYQGQEQHLPGGISPPMNRAPLWTTGYDTDAELYRYISALVHARRHFIKTPDYSESPSKVIYQDYHNMAMAKGTHDNVVITILQNNGASAADFNITLTGPALPPGTVFTELLTCTTLTVARNGTLNVPMKAGLPRVLHPQTALSNSGLCGTPPPLPPPPPSTTTTPTPQDPSPTNRASHTVPLPGLVAAALALFVPFTLEWLAMH